MENNFSKLFLLLITSMSVFSCTNNKTDPEPEELPPESSGDFISPDSYSFSGDFLNYEVLNNTYSSENWKAARSTGDMEILVIPATFDDVPNPDQNIITKLEKAFNGTQEETGWESLHSFYYASSYGQLNIHATIVDDFYEIPYTSYEMNESSANVTSNQVVDAVAWYKDKYHDDCKKYDKNGDGYIDTVMLIYAAEDCSRKDYGGEGENLWAYCYFANGRSSTSSPTPNTYFWASYDFMDGSSLIDIDAHTFIHEYGHCMGLQDYYNYDKESHDYPAAGFDMEDHNVGDHNGFSKMSFNWTKPYVVNGDCEITLRPTATNKDNYIIIPVGGYDGWNKTAFDEYLLIEFYTATGMNDFDAHNRTYGKKYPKGPEHSGIKLTHIDARIIGEYWYSYQYTDSVSSSYSSYEVAATNTTPGAGSSRISNLEEAQDYKLIKVISKKVGKQFTDTAFFSYADMFLKGDKFDMETYKTSFFHEGKMNEKKNGTARSLGFSFEVTYLSNSYASIKFTKD